MTASSTSQPTQGCCSPSTDPAALRRFAAKVKFDPVSGCVIWIGGTTSGRAGHVRYGAFKHQGKRWLAQRWAAEFIKGIRTEGRQIVQECGNPLCVEHVAGLDPDPDYLHRLRYQWVLVQVGVHEPPPEKEEIEDGVPYYEPPEWLKNSMETKGNVSDDPPF